MSAHLGAMSLPRCAATLLILVLASPDRPLQAQGTIDAQDVRTYLWSADQDAFREADASLRSAKWAVDVSRATMLDLEEIMRAGPPVFPGAPPTVGDQLNELVIETVGGRRVPVWVRLPSNWTPERQWPLMFAMHGGPPGNLEGAFRSAARMVDVWVASAESEGWIIASPAMVDVVSRDGRTADRLPYTQPRSICRARRYPRRDLVRRALEAPTEAVFCVWS